MPTVNETLQAQARAISGTSGNWGEDMLAALRILQSRPDGHLSELIKNAGGLPYLIAAGFGFFASGINHFFSQASFGAYTAGAKTLVTPNNWYSLGYTAATATSNPPGTVTLADGTVQYGAHNLVIYSEDISNAAWLTYLGASKVGQSRVVSWNGRSVTLWRVNVGTTGGAVSAASALYQSYSTFVASTQYTLQVVAMADSGTTPFRISLYWGSGTDVGTSDLTATTTPQAFSLPVTTGSTVSAGGNIAIRAATAGGAVGDLWVGAVMLNRGPAALDYVPTTSAAVYAPRLTCDRGATSNAIPYSQDWAQGWTKTNAADTISGQSITAGAVNSAHGIYRSITASASQWTVNAEFVRGPGQAAVGWTDNAVDYSAIVDLAAGTLVSVTAGATASVQPSAAGWVLSVTRTLVSGTVNTWWTIAKAGTTVFTGAGETVTCNGIWAHPGGSRLPYLRTFATAPLYASGTPTQQNLANGNGTQSITVTQGCVYSILHQTGGTYTLSGAATGTTTAGTVTTFVASTGTLTLTASSTPTLLQVWEGTGSMAYVAGPVSVYPQAGLLIEESRTNGVTNNSMQGAAAGSPGTIPTRWTQGGGAGLTRTIALGTELGQPYIDIRWTGTTSDTQLALYTEDNMTITAATSQARCHSAYVRMTAGSLTNISSTEIGILEQDSVGGFVTAAATPFTLTGSWQRAVRLHTTNATGTAYSKPYITLFYSSGVAIDIALRILLPQEEQGAFPTSPIVTSGAAVTRSADSVSWVGSFPSTTGTAVVEATTYIPSTGANRAVIATGDAMPVFLGGSGTVWSGDGTNQVSTLLASQAGTSFRAAVAWSGAVLKNSANGAALNTGTFDGAMGASSGFSVDSGLNGLLSRVALASLFATDAQVPQLSAATL